MRSLAPGLWCAESPLSFLGIELGAKMTVVRLADDTLLLHSPISATEPLLEEVRALGTVSVLVAPNRFHHLFVGDWQRAFPEARLYVAPGVERKRPDLTVTGLLDGGPVAGLDGALELLPLRGIPATNEIVFFHRPSATLIATDLAFHIDETSPPLTRGLFRMGGTFGRLAPTLLERFLVRNRAEFRESLRGVLEFPFERVVVAHGAVTETGGREQLERGYAWVLGAH